jgi:hypothetical protein
MREITLGNGPPPTIKYPGVEGHCAGSISCIERRDPGGMVSVPPLTRLPCAPPQSHPLQPCSGSGRMLRSILSLAGIGKRSVEADLEAVFAVLLRSTSREASRLGGASPGEHFGLAGEPLAGRLGSAREKASRR